MAASHANTGAGAPSHEYETDGQVECPICLDDFDTDSTELIHCGCGHITCQTCVKGFLLNTTLDPHCFHCKRAWDRDFQYAVLGTTFINKPYKKHRKQLLFEREKARMPETQPFVEQYKQVGALTKKLSEFNAKIASLRDETRSIETKRIQLHRQITLIKNGTCVLEPEEAKKKFIRKCPNDDCRGFLSSAYKCGMCKIFVCSKCLEIKGHTHDAEHECNPDHVKSAEMIKKETRPCPTCAVPIFKISGCNQMWCTQCKVAFSWKTGKIDHGRVHNPHFYQYGREHGGGVRNPGEQVCGGLPAYWRMTSMFRYTALDSRATTMDIHRGLIHLDRVILRPIRTKLQQVQNNQDLRIRFLCKEITDAHVATIVARRDNIRQKNTAMLHIFELYNVVMIEQFNNILNQFDINKSKMEKPKLNEEMKILINKMIKTANDTREYCNRHLRKISRNYKMKVHIIEKNFTIKSKMYKFY